MLLRQDDGSAQPLGELIAEAVECRAVITRFGASSGTGHLGPADRIGDSLAYDAALVRLCGRLGVAHDLTSDGAGPATRDQAEQRLDERLPGIASALRGTGTGFTVSEP
jgi:hypothetical protein